MISHISTYLGVPKDMEDPVLLMDPVRQPNRYSLACTQQEHCQLAELGWQETLLEASLSPLTPWIPSLEKSSTDESSFAC